MRFILALSLLLTTVSAQDRCRCQASWERLYSRGPQVDYNSIYRDSDGYYVIDGVRVLNCVQDTATNNNNNQDMNSIFGNRQLVQDQDRDLQYRGKVRLRQQQQQQQQQSCIQRYSHYTYRARVVDNVYPAKFLPPLRVPTLFLLLLP